MDRIGQMYHLIHQKNTADYSKIFDYVSQETNCYTSHVLTNFNFSGGRRGLRLDAAESPGRAFQVSMWGEGHM